MYSGIKSSRNGFHSIAYPMTDKKNQKGLRVKAFRCGGGIIDTGDIKGIQQQFAEIWRVGKRSQTGKHIQTYNLLFSFSKKELSPANSDSSDRAADLTSSVIERLYPGHQYILVVQADGKSGMLHVHAIVNSLHAKTLKACRGRQTSYRVLREEIEDELERVGIEIDRGESHRKVVSKKEYRIKKEKSETGYSWTEEIIEKIMNALGKTDRFSDLENNLNNEGVGVVKKQKKNWTFTLLSPKEASFKGRKVKGDKLSPELVPAKMRRIVDQNYLKSALGSYEIANESFIKAGD